MKTWRSAWHTVGAIHVDVTAFYCYTERTGIPTLPLPGCVIFRIILSLSVSMQDWFDEAHPINSVKKRSTKARGLCVYMVLFWPSWRESDLHDSGDKRSFRAMPRHQTQRQRHWQAEKSDRSSAPPSRGKSLHLKVT